MKSEVITGDDLSASKSAFLEKIDNFSCAINNKDYFLLGNSELITVGWEDCFRTFLKQFSKEEGAIKNLVINSLSKINASCPHAVELYIRTLIGDCPLTPLDQEVHSRRPSSYEILDDLKISSSDPWIINNFEFLTESLFEAGAGGHITINVKSSLQSNTRYIENGFKSRCYINDFFESINDVKASNCKVIIVNGKILDVSEIHHILQYSYDTKQPFVLIATGYSEDVSNTLLVNWNSNKTKVIPFCIRDDIESVNEVKDISTVCGIAPLTAELGNRISSIDISEIEQCGIFYNSNKKTLSIIPKCGFQERVQRLRNEIKKKIFDSKVDDVKQLLQQRLAKLNLRNVNIEMLGDPSSKGILEDKLNSFFSHVATCGSQGIVDIKQLYFSNYHIRFLPSLESKLAIKRAVSDRKVIDNIKAVIRMEQT